MSSKIEIYEAPNIMNLRGLTKEDTKNLDSIFESKFTENLFDEDSVVDVEKDDAERFKSPPEKFMSIEKWPKESLLHCSNCDLIIGGIPVPEIEKIITVDPFIADTNRRYFCDVLCLRRFIDHEYSGQKKDDKIKYMRIIYDKILNYECRAIINDEKNKEKVAKVLGMSKFTNIPPAPDKTLMKKYSGDIGITPEDYRNLKEQLKKEGKIGAYGFA